MAYPDVVLADSPLAYYRMDASSGTSETDQTGNGHAGTYSQGSAGGYTFSQAGATITDTDTAVAFDATKTGKCLLDTLGTLGAGMATASVEFWIKTTNSTTMQAVLSTIGTTVSPNQNLMSCFVNRGTGGTQVADRLFFALRGGSGAAAYFVIVSPGIFDGQWHHVVWTTEGTAASCTIRCYIDGVAKTVSTAQSNPFNFGSFVNFGYALPIGAENTRGAYASYFTGTLDEVAFYPTVLSPTQTVAHYNAARAYQDSAAGTITLTGTSTDSHTVGILAVNWLEAEDKFLSNVYRTTLAGGVGADAVSLTVADSPPGTPPQTPFYATVDRQGSTSMEIYKITAVGGAGNKTWTAEPNQAGTHDSVSHAHLDAAKIVTTLSLAEGYMGGDGNVSIDLGAGRVLWGFNDVIWATGAGQTRPGLPSFHNIIAIQTGYDLSTATIAWYPQTNSAGAKYEQWPDFISLDGSRNPLYRWTGAGCMLDDKLHVVSGASPTGGSGIQAGAVIEIVDNPADTPDNWQWLTVPMAGGPQLYGQPNYSSASMVDAGDGYVYIWASSTQTASEGAGFYASRVLRTDAKTGMYMNPQWWCGVHGWAYENPDRRIVKQIVLPTVPWFTQMATQHQRTDGDWQFTATDSSHMMYALRADPDGAWGTLTSAYTLPDHGGAIQYVGYAHPEQQWAGKNTNDVLCSWTPGLSSISQRPETYTPKFVKLIGI